MHHNSVDLLLTCTKQFYNHKQTKNNLINKNKYKINKNERVVTVLLDTDHKSGMKINAIDYSHNWR